MEFQECLEILKKRWILICTITLALTAVSAVTSFFIIKPTYKSDISVIIGKVGTGEENKTISYNDVLMYQRLVKTYSQLAKSRTVAENVIQSLGLNTDTEALQRMVSVSAKGDTEFLTIAVKSKNAEKSMLIANQLAKSLKEVSIIVKKVDNVQILDSARLPRSSDSPRPLLNTAIAFILGLMSSVALALLLDYMDNTIKTQADIEKLIGIPTIGLIPYETGVKGE